jgi:Histidine kinase-like ATPase domain
VRKGSRSMTTGSSGRGAPTESAREPLLELSLPATTASVPRARLRVEEAARAHVSRDCLDIVRQALTEVLSHVIAHSRIRSKVTIAVTVADAVYVQVSAPKARFARRLPGRSTEAGGLGLFIVGALADRWGFENGSNNRVWFSVPRWPDG